MVLGVRIRYSAERFDQLKCVLESNSIFETVSRERIDDCAPSIDVRRHDTDLIRALIDQFNDNRPKGSVRFFDLVRISVRRLSIDILLRLKTQESRALGVSGLQP